MPAQPVCSHEQGQEQVFKGGGLARSSSSSSDGEAHVVRCNPDVDVAFYQCLTMSLVGNLHLEYTSNPGQLHQILPQKPEGLVQVVNSPCAVFAEIPDGEMEAFKQRLCHCLWSEGLETPQLGVGKQLHQSSRSCLDTWVAESWSGQSVCGPLWHEAIRGHSFRTIPDLATPWTAFREPEHIWLWEVMARRVGTWRDATQGLSLVCSMSGPS